MNEGDPCIMVQEEILELWLWKRKKQRECYGGLNRMGTGITCIMQSKEHWHHVHCS